MGDTLFRHRKLTDYEKLLFTEKELADLKVEFGKNQAYITELEDTGKAKDRKIQSLEAQLSNLKKRESEWGQEIKESKIYKDLNQKYKNLEGVVSRLRNDNRNLINKTLQ